LGRHDTSDPFGECDDDHVDGRATASSGPQSSGAASHELVDCGQRHRAHLVIPVIPAMNVDASYLTQ